MEQRTRLDNLWERLAIAVLVLYVSLLSYVGHGLVEAVNDVSALAHQNQRELDRRGPLVARSEQIPRNQAKLDVLQATMKHLEKDVQAIREMLERYIEKNR